MPSGELAYVMFFPCKVRSAFESGKGANAHQEVGPGSRSDAQVEEHAAMSCEVLLVFGAHSLTSLNFI